LFVGMSATKFSLLWSSFFLDVKIVYFNSL